MVTHIARVWINLVWLPILLGVSCTGKMDISLSSRLRVWSCEAGSAVPSRVSFLLSILRLSLVRNYGGYSGVPRRRPSIILNRDTRSGHAIAYRWCLLPRVRRHRASKSQGSSEQVLPWQVIMDPLICASLSRTHCWYEVGIFLRNDSMCGRNTRNGFGATIATTRQDERENTRE